MPRWLPALFVDTHGYCLVNSLMNVIMDLAEVKDLELYEVPKICVH